MVSVLTVGEVITRKICPVQFSSAFCSPVNGKITYPEIMISSSTPYSFICCKPHPSLILFGMYFFLNPVKFGVWYILISTLSAPNSETRGASNDAHEAFGDSLVPLNASVKMLSFNLGFALRACCSVEI